MGTPRHMDDDLPLSFRLYLTPGLLEVLATLDNQAGAIDDRELLDRVGHRYTRSEVAHAVRTLAAYGMIRRIGHGGSWDEPGPRSSYAISEHGQRFATVVRELHELVTRHLHAHRHTSR